MKTLEKLKQKIEKILLFKVVTLASVSDRFGKSGSREMARWFGQDGGWRSHENRMNCQCFEVRTEGFTGRLDMDCKR